MNAELERYHELEDEIDSLNLAIEDTEEQAHHLIKGGLGESAKECSQTVDYIRRAIEDKKQKQEDLADLIRTVKMHEDEYEEMVWRINQ